MATLAELAGLRGSAGWDDLVHKIRAAAAIKAVAIAEEATPTAEELAWAKAYLAGPAAMADQIVHYVVADNAGFTTAQILGASDAAIQTAVNAAVDNLLGK
jgi:hypothetical protein